MFIKVPIFGNGNEYLKRKEKRYDLKSKSKTA